MTDWVRIHGGWAINLDGSDAALGFSLPRVEVRASPTGWTSECFLADGSRASCALAYPGGVAAVLAEAVAQAQRLVRAADRTPAPAPPPVPGPGLGE